jgi:hypothetical protein
MHMAHTEYEFLSMFRVNTRGSLCDQFIREQRCYISVNYLRCGCFPITFVG